MASERELRARMLAYNSLTKEQYAFLLKNKDKMLKKDLAKAMGINLTKLRRVASYKNLKFNFYRKEKCYSKEEIALVVDYYEKHGRMKTEKKFPKLNFRSIVERNKHKPRQIPWTAEQKLEGIKMANFVPMKDQAKYFNRPRAFRGSIVSLWAKTLKIKKRNMHGWSGWIAKEFIDIDKCPYIELSFWHKRQKMYLWSDMENFILPNVPDMIKESIYSMAEFQRWLYGTIEPRSEILRIIHERSDD